MTLLTIALILILTADVATTWYCLAKYPKRVKEFGLLGKLLSKYGMLGQLVFVGVRIILVALVIEFTTWGGMAGMQIVTGYAVINNLLVIRKLNG